MFTGIVQVLGRISGVQWQPQMLKYAVRIAKESLQDLKLGASISVNGICQTVVKIEDDQVWFDAIQETLNRTTLQTVKLGDEVNIERSIKFGDEVGGHVLSGHVFGTATIASIVRRSNECIFTYQVPQELIKYFFSKGYIALDGVSLTLVDVDEEASTFTTHLIPETLKLTTFGKRKEKERVNVEIDSQTQTIVDTITRIMKQKYAHDYR